MAMQYSVRATRSVPGQRETCLDLVFTKTSEDIVTAPTAKVFKKAARGPLYMSRWLAVIVIVATRTVLEHSLAFYVACRERFLSETCSTCVDWVIRGALVIDCPLRTWV